MEVSTINDHVTHAVIGGARAIDFGISDSAEFFQILSSTLYTDQKLAVVRETMCNAWDAHIDAGLQHIPIEIVIDDEVMSFRDFGKGIHDDMIGPIYGVYGASTKKKDKNVTGGFGLGCKAPFAYTDHFEVISHHEGRKTIYAMSRSSAEVNGKPGITPIATFPTTETGIKVTIQVNDNFDRNTFIKLVKQIAYNGNINAKLNGQQLLTLPYDKAKNGFILTKDDIGTNYPVVIKYGAVIYPVPAHPKLSNIHIQINKILESMSQYRGRDNRKLILIAEPNTIAVTPSREALSMSEHTVNTLSSLMNKFLADYARIDEPRCNQIIDESVTNTWLNSKPGELFDTRAQMPTGRYIRKPEFIDKTITEYEDIVDRRTAYHYPLYNKFRENDILRRLEGLEQSGFGNRGMIQTYRKELIDERKLGVRYSDWLMKRVIAPLITKLEYTEGMSPKGLRCLVQGSMNTTIHGYKTLIDASKMGTLPIIDQLPYLRNIVVLAYNRNDVFERMGSFPIMRHWLGDSLNTLVYIVSRNTKRATIAREFFQKQGVVLIDMTIAQPWEHKDIIVPNIRLAPATPRKKGIPALSNMRNGNLLINPKRSLLFDENAVRLMTPKAFIKLNPKSVANRLDGHNAGHSRLIIESIGDVTGVVVNANQENKYTKEQGAIHYMDYIFKIVEDEFDSSPELQKMIQMDHLSIGWDNNITRALDIIKERDSLQKYFGLNYSTDIKAMGFFKLWRMLREMHEHSFGHYHNIFVKLNKKIGAIAPTHQDIIDVYTKLHDKKDLLDLLDLHTIKVSMHETVKPHRAKVAIGLLMHILRA